MPNNNYLFTLDEETADILKQVPKSKRSAYVREGVKLKARSIEGEPQEKEERPKREPRVHILQRAAAN